MGQKRSAATERSGDSWDFRRFGGALEAEGEAVRVVEVELFHAVGSNGRGADGDTLGEELLIGRVRIGAGEIEAGIVMGSDAGRIGRDGALVVEFVGSVKHDLRVAQLEQSPVEAILAKDRRSHFHFESELVAIKPNRSGHVIDLEERSQSAHIERHLSPRRITGNQIYMIVEGLPRRGAACCAPT